MHQARSPMEPTMPLKKEFSDLRVSFEPLTLYQKFEHVCVLVLTALIAIIIVLALWNLTLKILAQHLGNQFRSDRLCRVPSDIRHDLHRHHCARVQALAAGAGRAARQYPAGR
jgi:hypothetical protein